MWRKMKTRAFLLVSFLFCQLVNLDMTENYSIYTSTEMSEITDESTSKIYNNCFSYVAKNQTAEGYNLIYPDVSVQAMRPWLVTFDRTCTVICYVIGIPANLLSTFVWLNKNIRENNSSVIYLATLAVNDCLFLVCHILQELVTAWAYDSKILFGDCGGYFAVLFTLRYASFLYVLAFTTERWIAVRYPLKRAQYCTPRRAKIVVASIFGIACTFGSVQILLTTYDSYRRICVIKNPLGDNFDRTFHDVWSYFTEIIFSGVSTTVILILNISVIWELKKMSSNSADRATSIDSTQVRTTTLTLLAVSFYTITANFLISFFYLTENLIQFDIDFSQSKEEVANSKAFRNYLDFKTISLISNEFWISQYAFNFFVYVITGKVFRETLIELLHGIKDRICQFCKRNYSGNQGENEQIDIERIAIEIENL